MRFGDQNCTAAQYDRAVWKRVHERVGKLVVPLFREGNLAERVGIICKTRSGLALEGSDFIGINSTIWFDPLQASATCNITIIDDTYYESSEDFFVSLEENAAVGMAKPVQGASEIRVIINADNKDG